MNIALGILVAILFLVVLGAFVYCLCWLFGEWRHRRSRRIETEQAASQARLQWATHQAVEDMLKAAREGLAGKGGARW